MLAVLILRPTGLLHALPRRRQDTRDEVKSAGHIVRLSNEVAWCAGIAGLLIVLALPLVVTDDGILSSIVITGILFIALMGLDVLMGYAGQVSLGQAGFMAIGGYTSGYLAINYGLPPVVGIVAGVVASATCALILSLVTLRLRGLYLALATLAFGLLINSCAIGFVDITGGPSGLVGLPSFTIAGYEVQSPRSMYYVIVGLDLVILVLLLGAVRSGFGRALKAIRSDQLAATGLRRQCDSI